MSFTLLDWSIIPGFPRLLTGTVIHAIEMKHPLPINGP